MLLVSIPDSSAIANAPLLKTGLLAYKWITDPGPVCGCVPRDGIIQAADTSFFKVPVGKVGPVPVQLFPSFHYPMCYLNPA